MVSSRITGPYACVLGTGPKCAGKIFKQRKDLYAHEVSVHGLAFSCQHPNCDKVYKKWNGYRNHCHVAKHDLYHSFRLLECMKAGHKATDTPIPPYAKVLFEDEAQQNIANMVTFHLPAIKRNASADSSLPRPGSGTLPVAPALLEGNLGNSPAAPSISSSLSPQLASSDEDALADGDSEVELDAQGCLIRRRREGSSEFDYPMGGTGMEDEDFDVEMNDFDGASREEVADFLQGEREAQESGASFRWDEWVNDEEEKVGCSEGGCSGQRLCNHPPQSRANWRCKKTPDNMTPDLDEHTLDNISEVSDKKGKRKKTKAVRNRAGMEVVKRK